MGIFTPFNQGDAFNPSAAQLNSWIRAAKQATVAGDRRGGPKTNFDPAGYLWAWVKNTTGALREQYDVVSLRGVSVRHGVNASEYKDRPYFKAIAPDPAICPAIFLEPCPVNAIRRAAFMGLVPCRINATAEGNARAVIVAGQYGHLDGGDAGYEIVDIDVGDEEDEEWEFEAGIKTGIIQIGGGGGGSTIAHGRLVKSIPASAFLADAVELWAFSAGSPTEEGGFYGVVDESDAQVVLKGYNTSDHSVIRGDAVTKVWVEGEVKTTYLLNPAYDAEDEESEQYIAERVFYVYSNLDPLAIAEGFVPSPDNDKGQGLMHRDGQKATIADGAPCGGA